MQTRCIGNLSGTAICLAIFIEGQLAADTDVRSQPFIDRQTVMQISNRIKGTSTKLDMEMLKSGIP